MPIYEYRCPHGPHVIDHVHRLSDGARPETIVCEQHDMLATYQIALPAVGVVSGSDNPVRPKREWSEEERTQAHRGLDLGSFDYHCTACDKDFNDIVDFRAGETAEAPRQCPTCGAASALTFSPAKVDGTIKMYPYYDRGLDMVVKSAQHRAEVCKERGLIPVDGDFDAERMYADATRPAREAEEWYKSDMKKRWNEPEMREWRDNYKARHGRDFAQPF